jgi:beta-lactam-binding protein with PASTA domain
MAPMKSFFRMVLIALVLLLVALVSALTAMRLAIHGREVAMPNLLGKSPGEARLVAEQNGLQLEVERRYYSATVPEGKVMSQIPAAGTLVRRGWQVRVAESLGPQRVQIPDVVGQSQRAAEFNIRRRGLDIGAVAQIEIPGTPVDQVVSQSPPANASDVAAPKISLLVTEPSSPQTFVMPSFLGQTLGSVMGPLQDAGLRMGVVTLAGQTGNPFSPPMITTPQAAAGSLIVAQNPGPGQKLTAGSAVNFEVR